MGDVEHPIERLSFKIFSEVTDRKSVPETQLKQQADTAFSIRRKDVEEVNRSLKLVRDELTLRTGWY